jgi:hypothetical protein
MDLTNITGSNREAGIQANIEVMKVAAQRPGQLAALGML